MGAGRVLARAHLVRVVPGGAGVDAGWLVDGWAGPVGDTFVLAGVVQLERRIDDGVIGDDAVGQDPVVGEFPGPSCEQVERCGAGDDILEAECRSTDVSVEAFPVDVAKRGFEHCLVCRVHHVTGVLHLLFDQLQADAVVTHVADQESFQDETALLQQVVGGGQGVGLRRVVGAGRVDGHDGLSPQLVLSEPHALA